MITLYHALLSTCSQKVRYGLAEKGLAYESRPINLGRAEHLEDWYLAINPNGVVPSLTHDGKIVVDSSVICEYLDEAFGPATLTPDTAYGRAQMRAWMRYFEEVPTTAIRAPSFNQLFIKQIGSRPEVENDRIREKMPLRKHFYKKMGQTGFAPDVIEESRERLTACLSRVNAAVLESGPFLLGEQLTIADIVLLPTVVRMEDLGMGELWKNMPGTVSWYSAMQNRPAFAAAYQPGVRFFRPDGGLP